MRTSAPPAKKTEKKSTIQCIWDASLTNRKGSSETASKGHSRSALKKDTAVTKATLWESHSTMPEKKSSSLILAMRIGAILPSLLFVAFVAVGLLLSILHIFAAVKNEAFLKNAPGSAFLKSAGVFHLIIALIFGLFLYFELPWFTHRHGFAHIFWSSAIITMSYVCFHALVGIIGIMFNKKQNRAGLLRDLSIAGLLPKLPTKLYLLFQFV